MSWESWLFAFNVTVPGILMLLLGIFLRRIGWIDEAFNTTASRLVFNITLPCLIFFGMTNNHTDISEHLSLAVFGAVATIATYLLLELIATFLIKERRERGIFVQGGFRSNAAIMGLAYSSIAYGSEGVILGSIYMISTVVLFNVLSIITLTRTLSTSSDSLSLKRIMMSIVKNPLILSIAAGLSFSLLDIPIAEPITRTGQFMSAMTLPLAMLCTGASINFRAMFYSSNTAMLATFMRSAVVPLLVTFGAYVWGFTGISLGVVFLLSATPAAVASYVMTRAMGGDATLAANIIAMTTIASFFTAALGLSILRSNGLI